MPAQPRAALPRTLALSVLLGLSGAAVHASGSHAEAPAKSDPEAAAAVRKPTVPERAASAVAAPTKDPMETLRERLASKLGAGKSVEAGAGNSLRIVAKAGAAPSGVDSDGHAGAPPAARAAPRVAAASHAAVPRGVVPAAAGHAAHWGYGGSDAAGAGPDRWASLKPEFAQCASGSRQSPIDIRDGIRVDLEPVRFDYRPTAFRVVDNGHTVQVNVGPGSSIETAGGRRFDLVQFHFHRPSEERIDGRQFEMVAHLVHKDLEGRLAVVAVLLDRGPAHAVVQNVWNNLPLEKGEELAARGTLNLTDLLPADRSYFTYMGSLTTPPCSEGVLWMVLRTPVGVSTDQIGIFARLYPMNARPLQAAAGRLIKESN